MAKEKKIDLAPVCDEASIEQEELSKINTTSTPNEKKSKRKKLQKRQKEENATVTERNKEKPTEDKAHQSMGQRKSDADNPNAHRKHDIFLIILVGAIIFVCIVASLLSIGGFIYQKITLAQMLLYTIIALIIMLLTLFITRALQQYLAGTSLKANVGSDKNSDIDKQFLTESSKSDYKNHEELVASLEDIATTVKMIHRNMPEEGPSFNCVCRINEILRYAGEFDLNELMAPEEMMRIFNLVKDELGKASAIARECITSRRGD